MDGTSEGRKPAALKISVMGLHAAAWAISMSDGTLSSSSSPLPVPAAISYLFCPRSHTRTKTEISSFYVQALKVRGSRGSKVRTRTPVVYHRTLSLGPVARLRALTCRRHTPRTQLYVVRMNYCDPCGFHNSFYVAGAKYSSRVERCM